MAHAAGFAAAVEQLLLDEGLNPRPESFVDLGTGAGIPGLVLAARWKEARALLLDANEARIGSLRTLLDTLGWGERVEVARARAEVLGRDPHARGRFALAVARGFGAPPVAAECGAALLRPGGLLVVSEPPFEPAPGAQEAGGATAEPEPSWGPGAWDTTRWPTEGLAQLGLEPVRWHHGRFGYQLLRQATPCPERFPRREGVPGKRPLWR
ncbi:MAG: class I SAM-dependent methyltransferase [Acidobacteriota bacterium]|nr:class I SAM-dependent methyltransferase [Acidobacteriota bacterium]